MLMNLKDMAQANSENLTAQYKALTDKITRQGLLKMLDAFASSLKEDLHISINMKETDLNGFLTSGKYLSIHELKRQQKEELKERIKTEVSEKQGLKKHLKSYYKRRVAFDLTFEGGEKFKYAALNMGGLGLTKRGEYSIIIKAKQLDKYEVLIFVKEDSLNYVDKHGHVNIDKFSNDVATRRCVYLLASLKHKNEIEKIVTQKSWFLICCDECNIEAITSDEILDSHAESVRMGKNDYLWFYDHLFRDFVSEISKMDKYRLSMFLGIRKLMDKQAIKLEVIDKNAE